MEVWKVFLHWFHPRFQRFQKRFGEPRLCRAVEASTQLLVLQHSSSSKAIVDDDEDEEDEDEEDEDEEDEDEDDDDDDTD